MGSVIFRAALARLVEQSENDLGTRLWLAAGAPFVA